MSKIIPFWWLWGNAICIHAVRGENGGTHPSGKRWQAYPSKHQRRSYLPRSPWGHDWGCESCFLSTIFIGSVRLIGLCPLVGESDGLTVSVRPDPSGGAEACAMHAEVPPHFRPAGLRRREGGGQTFAAFYAYEVLDWGDYPPSTSPPPPSSTRMYQKQLCFLIHTSTKYSFNKSLGKRATSVISLDKRNDVYYQPAENCFCKEWSKVSTCAFDTYEY